MPKTESDINSDLVGVTAWAISWESRAKFIAAIIYIFGVISLNTPLLVTVCFAVSFMSALCMGLSISLILKRYLLIAPFILLMTVPLIIGGGFPVDPDQITFASLILSKSVTAMTVMTIILNTQSMDQFITSLAHLKIPSIIITILLLSYRYVFIFFEDIQKMQIALKSRFFSGKISWENIKIYGQLTGALLVKSLDRADNVYNAMSARCFNGMFRFGKANKITVSDILKTSLVFLFILVIILWEKILILS